MERSEYIEQRNGGFYVAGSRVSLDSIVHSFKAGDSPETIRQNFASLSLEQVYGAIAFYLAHEQEVDSNIREGEAEIESSGFAVDYFEARHAETLMPISTLADGPVRLLVAAKLGRTRLIDNIKV